jgi:amino acid transporter
MIIFVKVMFYKDKRSPFKYLMGMAIILKIIDFILRSYIPYPLDETLELGQPGLPFYYLNVALTVSMVLLTYPWLAYSTLSSFKSIKEKSVNPWIKKRYLILGIAASIASLESLFYMFLPYTPALLDNLQYAVMVLLIASNEAIFSIGNVLGWMMPRKLKQYFDRNYEPSAFEVIPEEELIEKIKNELARKK